MHISMYRRPIQVLKSALAITKMIREIKYNNTIIKYDLQYKKVKNINLHIKSDCSVNVSANNIVQV